ncbi:MAG: hypothetical protein C5B51_31695, partial [Terriglobia bacterium]
PAEALTKLDEGVYDLVLSDEKIGMGQAGPDLLAYARVKAYHPATAIVTSNEFRLRPITGRSKHHISIYTENIPHLLWKVADLIGLRASRRYRPLRQAV